MIFSRLTAGCLILAPCALALMGGASNTALAAQDALVAVSYDLTSIAPVAHVGAFEAPLFPLLDLEGETGSLELESESGAHTVARILSFLFDADLKGPGRELQIEAPERLRIVAPQALHQEIAVWLPRLSEVLQAPIEVRLDVLDRPATASVQGGPITLAEAEKLIASGPYRSFTLRIPRGRVGVLDATSLHRVVAGFDVEVAELAAQFGPRMEHLRSGPHWAVRAAAVSGGVKLAVSALDSALGPIRQRELQLGGTFSSESGVAPRLRTNTLDLPSIHGMAGGFNLFVPTGKAAVLDSSLALESGTGRRTWIVRAAPIGPSKAVVLRRQGLNSPVVRVLDAGGLHPPSAVVFGNWMGFETVGDLRVLESPFGSRRRMSVQLPPPALTDVLQRWNDRSSELLAHGPFVIALARDEAQLPADTEPRVEPRAVQLSWKLERLGDARVTLAAGAVPLTLGEMSAWVQGAETRFVESASVEIASKVSALIPEVGSVLDGLIFWARPSRGAEGGFDCELSVSVHVLAGPMRQVSVGAPLAIDVDLADWDVLTVRDTLRARSASEGARLVSQGGGGLELTVELR